MHTADVCVRRRMTQVNGTEEFIWTSTTYDDPVRHARADVARAQGHLATRYGTHYGTLNPRDEAQAAYANRRRRSSRMKTGQVAIAVVIALILLWLVVTLVSSCVQGGATKDAASSDAQTTVTGTVSTSTN